MPEAWSGENIQPNKNLIKHHLLFNHMAEQKKAMEAQLGNVTDIIGKLKDKESRQELLADDKMEPHIYLATLLLVVLVLAVAVGLIF